MNPASDNPDPAAASPRLSDQLGPLVEAAGMVNYLNHGAASHVHSEGCSGVTQEHLERFAALLLAAERGRLIAALRAASAAAPMTDKRTAFLWAADFLERA